MVYSVYVCPQTHFISRLLWGTVTGLVGFMVADCFKHCAGNAESRGFEPPSQGLLQ